MIHPWWGEILFGLLFGIGFAVATWAIGKLLK